MKTALKLLLVAAWIALVALQLSACSGSLKHVNRIGLGLSTITTACDWGQTRSAATKGWRDHYEANPVMGSTPSTGRVDAYLGAVIASTVLLGYVLPEKLRPFLYGAVIAIEVDTIAGNMSTTEGLCGIAGGPAR